MTPGIIAAVIACIILGALSWCLMRAEDWLDKRYAAAVWMRPSPLPPLEISHEKRPPTNPSGREHGDFPPHRSLLLAGGSLARRVLAALGVALFTPPQRPQRRPGRHEPPALSWCGACCASHVPLAPGATPCEPAPPCPDCEAPLGRSCYPDCLRYADVIYDTGETA